jgi:hypothetical protein
MKERGNACRILAGKLYNIKLDLREIDWGGFVDWIHRLRRGSSGGLQ